MLTSIEGTYRNGQIELKEAPVGIEESLVIVTFMNASNGVDLRARGISQNQASELHAALSTFEDWNEPEMDIYNDYDAAKSDS
jgi:hypothetical protein